MVGRVTLDHLVQVRILVLQPKLKPRRYRLEVRTGGSQPSDRGSIPRSAAKFLCQTWDLRYIIISGANLGLIFILIRIFLFNFHLNNFCLFSQG